MTCVSCILDVYSLDEDENFITVLDDMFQICF
jgi:hypothetical protein